MPQCQIIDTGRENIFADMGQRADVKFSYAVTFNGFSTGCKEVSHSNDRDIAVLSLLFFCNSTDIGIMPLHTFNEIGILVFYAFTGLYNPDIPVAQIRNRTHNRFRNIRNSFKENDLVFRVLCDRTHNMDIQSPQQFFGRIQKRRGIMVARNDHHMAAIRCRNLAEKAVIKFLRPVTGGTGIENITADQQCIDRFAFYQSCQPVKKC